MTTPRPASPFSPAPPTLPPKAPLVASVEMGYGHLRAAHALADALGTDVLHVDQPPLVDAEEQALWRALRRLYEFTSRSSQVPVVGARWVRGRRSTTDGSAPSGPNVGVPAAAPAAPVLDSWHDPGAGDVVVVTTASLGAESLPQPARRSRATRAVRSRRTPTPRP